MALHEQNSSNTTVWYLSLMEQFWEGLSCSLDGLQHALARMAKITKNGNPEDKSVRQNTGNFSQMQWIFSILKLEEKIVHGSSPRFYGYSRIWTNSTLLLNSWESLSKTTLLGLILTINTTTSYYIVFVRIKWSNKYECASKL